MILSLYWTYKNRKKINHFVEQWKWMSVNFVYKWKCNNSKSNHHRRRIIQLTAYFICHWSRYGSDGKYNLQNVSENRTCVYEFKNLHFTIVSLHQNRVQMSRSRLLGRSHRFKMKIQWNATHFTVTNNDIYLWFAICAQSPNISAFWRNRRKPTRFPRAIPRSPSKCFTLFALSCVQRRERVKWNANGWFGSRKSRCRRETSGK